MTAPFTLHTQIRICIPDRTELSFAGAPGLLAALDRMTRAFFLEQRVSQSGPQGRALQWKALCLDRPEIAQRIQKMALQAIADTQEGSPLEVAPLVRWVANAPTWAGSPLSPDEPLPFELSERALTARQDVREAILDVLMTLHRLKTDPGCRVLLEPLGEGMHPEMEIFWNNVSVSLFEERTQSPLRQLLYRELREVTLPLKRCQRDGLDPLTRLAQTGTPQAVLMALVEAHSVGTDVFTQETLPHLILTLARKQMWPVIAGIRQRGWDGSFPLLSQCTGTLAEAGELSAAQLAQLLQAGMESPELLHEEEDLPVVGAVLLRTLMHSFPVPIGCGSSFAERLKRSAESASGRSWGLLWAQLTPALQKDLLQKWLAGPSIVTMLASQEAVGALHWLLTQREQLGISRDAVAWPSQPWSLPTESLLVLCTDWNPPLEPLAMQMFCRHALYLGEAESLAQLFEQLEGKGHPEALLEQILEYSSAEPVEPLLNQTVAQRRRMRNALQVIERSQDECSWIHLTPTERLVRSALQKWEQMSLVIGTTQTLTDGERDLEVDQWKQRAEKRVGRLRYDWLERAWEEPLCLDASHDEWRRCQRRVLAGWADHLLHDPLASRRFAILWLDLLTLREGVNAPTSWLLPQDPQEESDFEGSLRQFLDRFEQREKSDDSLKTT